MTTYAYIRQQQQQLERGEVRAVLQRHEWVISRAAAELGVSVHCLYRAIARIGLSDEYRVHSPGPGRLQAEKIPQKKQKSS